ncbi:carbohydrate kinase family protein [Microvirga lotononidis]|uniref:Sugar kinase, ribokinase n=1 Tax=Microvirga lotononidis TaxID=864069 RepID=I4YT80_9HYPH|nr:sugar kinase [Microvirga lotononidis]EIM27172.1 sugar kinase, ribokinase [Microvirga lotononidis]WQO28645.1 sugar kinase [Microvirga lotononidis]
MTERVSERNKVLCLGRIYCDIIFTGLRDMPVLGRERFADDVTVVAGGGAYITAAHLASLGRPSALLTRLGTDPLSKGLDPELEGSGIDLTFVERSPDAGPQPTVALVKDGERAFVSRRAGTSRPASLEKALAAPDIAHLHIAEFATLKDNPDVIAMARERGLTVSLDPSWDDELIRQDAGFFETCAGVDVFLPNVEEGEALTGEASPEAILSALREHFPLVVLKRGEHGAVASKGSASVSARAMPVTVVDTTGAGDAFNAGFLHSWLGTADIERGLAAGIEAGALSVQSPGGAPPRR